MPDISKCVGEGCPLRERCWRYVCRPDPLWQSYSAYYTLLRPGYDCLYFWEITRA